MEVSAPGDLLPFQYEDVHFKLDYCNSLYFNLPRYQIKRLQLLQTSLARAVLTVYESAHISSIFRSLLWLKTNQI